MPRIVWNEAPEAAGNSSAIVVHYQSPHEFVKDIEPRSSPERLFLRTERPLPLGSRRKIILHIGFVARELRLNAHVEKVTTPAEARGSGTPAGMSLTLVGQDGCASPELRNLIQQIQQGLASQAAAGSTVTTDERVPKSLQLLKMPATLKLMHAIKADLEDRLILAADLDPRCIEFLLKNPGISLAEIRALSARPTLTTSHIQTILANRAWSADEQVRLSLARNPRLPDMFVEQILEPLSVLQLKIVAGSATITAKTKRIAHRILYERGH